MVKWMKHIKKIACATLAVLLITGCAKSSMANKDDRFFCIGHEFYFDIYVDSQTGVEYAVSTVAYNMGTLTLLVNSDGSPLIWEGYECQK